MISIMKKELKSEVKYRKIKNWKKEEKADKNIIKNSKIIKELQNTTRHVTGTIAITIIYCHLDSRGKEWRHEKIMEVFIKVLKPKL